MSPTPSTRPGPAPPPRLLVENATCVACGCLCDDIALGVEQGRIVEARHACAIGRRWFLADHGPGDAPPAAIEGRPVEPAEAVARAAEILRAARAPVVLGLTATTTEAVGQALALADRIGAVVDPGAAEAANARLLAFQRVGRVSATLGEVKNRADVVVFWGVDPVATHPRHLERYSVEPIGRFVSGRRLVIVADAERTATVDRADLFIQVAPEARFETLWALRALVRGVALDPARTRRATGLDIETLTNLADHLKSARYGAFFHGEEAGGQADVEAALSLVRDLNRFTRFVILPMGAAGNAAGAEAILTWQSGFPASVSWERGFPTSLPGETSVEARLARGEADAALIVGDPDATGLSEAARLHLSELPRIAIGPRATGRDRGAAVALVSATYSIDAPGTVMRVDGVTLPLRPPLAATVPTDREWLRAILDRILLED